MKLYEYQGKELFQNYNIPIPKGKIIENPDDIQDIPLPCVIKSQVLIGGRGKAGGIKVATNIQEAKKHIEDLLGSSVRGYTVKKILVEKKLNIQKEYYLSLLLDRESRCPLLMFSPTGGVNIEEVPEDQISLIRINPLIGLQNYTLRKVPGIDKEERKKLIPIIHNLYRLFKENDLELAEINPLALVDREMMAVDSKIIIDDGSLFRHATPPMDEELTPLEREAKEKGISFIQLDGTIGVIANGAGLTMATLDALNEYGGKGGVFLDLGGTDDPEKVKQAFALMKKANPQVILLNLFGGITKCDTVATGVTSVIKSEGINCPVVARIKGMNEQEAKAILKKYVITATTLKDAAQKASELGG